MKKWKMDDAAISVIESCGLSWSTDIIAADDIDVKRSRSNCSRVTRIDDDAVEGYKGDMEAGDVFPMIVVVKLGRKYVIAGGNHRHEAAVRAGITEFEVILVEADALMFTVLCQALNSVEGMRTSVAERSEQAAQCVINTGISGKQAAELYRVPIKRVQEEVRAFDTVQQAAEHGVTIPRNVSKTSIQRLHKRTSTKPVFAKMANLVAVVNPTLRELRELDRRVDACSSVDEQLDLIEKETKTKRPEGRKVVVRRPRRDRLFSAIRQMEKVFDIATTAQTLQLELNDIKELKTRWENLSAIMDEIL